MKKILLSALVALLALPAIAREFTYNNIHYKVLDEAAKTCATTSPNTIPPNADIVIPGYVSDGTGYYTVTEIGAGSFLNNQYDSFTISLPNTVTKIGFGAFEYTKLKEIKLSSSLQTIDNLAFFGCQLLTEIQLPSSLRTINDGAFGLTNITRLNIPASVEYIGYLENCEHLAEINVDPANKFFSSREGVWYNKEQTVLIRCPREKVGDVVIPPTVTELTEGSIDECIYINSVTIPNSVTNIPNGICSNCRRLASVYLPSTIKSLNKSFLKGSNSLTSIVIEDGSNYIYARDGIMYLSENDNTILYKYPGGIEKESYTISSDVTEIAADAFSGGKFKYITIPESVKIINSYAFYECENLISVDLPNSIEEIKDHTFYCCYLLASVSIPESVKSIGNFAFDQCANLVSVSIPASVKTLGDYWLRCPESIYYNTSEPLEWSASDYWAHPWVTLFIRPEGVEAAKTIAPWNQIENIVAYDFDNIDKKDYYLVGGFNGWINGDENFKFTRGENGEYTLDYDGLIACFRITDGTWEDAGIYGANTVNRVQNVTEGQTYALAQPGQNAYFDEFVGIEKGHFVFNPVQRTVLVTGTPVKCASYDLWGNFSSGITEWNAVKLKQSDDNAYLWIAKDILVENECEFVVRGLFPNQVGYSFKAWDNQCVIDEPGTYSTSLYAINNFRLAPGKWDLTFNTDNNRLIVESATGAVEKIEIDVQDDVTPLYYNLQGVRVDKPANGLYIVVRGAKVTKEYIK